MVAERIDGGKLVSRAASTAEHFRYVTDPGGYVIEL
jgi:hypothetical protein